MSLQWTAVAVFLYSEIFLAILFMLPFISPTRWNSLFKSRLIGSLRSYSNVYFTIFIAVLVLLFIDAIRDVRRYSISHEDLDLNTNPSAEIQVHMKLFRAQRNLYIAGFALFMWFILRKLVTLLSAQATLIASNEASLKQAKSATDAAQKLLQESEDKKKKEKDAKPSVTEVVDAAVAQKEKDKELSETILELEKTREALHRANLDLEAMRKQAESTNKEYDRLMSEHTKLQDKVNEGGESKKDS